MSACQLLANSSSSTILSCKACPDCNVLFNHSFFCIVECMIPTTTVPPTTTTVPPTTTVSPTTTVPPTTTFLTTTIRYNSTTAAVKNVTSTTTTTLLPTTTMILKNQSSRIINHSDNPSYRVTNYSEIQEFSEDDFLVFLVLCLPMAIIIIVILYHCLCKKTLKKNRVVIPQDVTIDIANENNEQTVEEDNVDDENSKVIHHIVKAVVNDLIKQVENIHNTKRKLPSIATASKTLQRLQAVNRRTRRKRRERQLNSLVLRNMNTEEKPLTHGMRIKEIFEQSKENQDKKDNYDLI